MQPPVQKCILGHKNRNKYYRREIFILSFKDNDNDNDSIK